MPPTSKVCKMCSVPQIRENFYKLQGKSYKSSWDCRSSICKTCQSIKTSQTRRATKLQAIEYLGGCCRDCELKSVHSCIYDFHHLDPTQKDISFGKVNKSFAVLKPELDKCILLCSNCHRIRHYSNIK